MRYINAPFVLSPTNGDMSQATVTTVVTPNGPGDNRHLRFTAFQAVFTGAPVGTLQLQGSTDNINWAPIGSAVAVSSAGNSIWDLIDTGCHYLRIVYTRTSGTGTLTANFSAKGE